MILPKRLRNWHVLLSLFPDEIAKDLGEIILRLSVAIGPLKHGVFKGNDEPDGFEGLTVKGNVEHLIPSEWLLADEIPHEFDRRAAMGEQLYFRLNKIEHKKGLVSVLLFDSGPMQLGGPKIVQLALLILFARRAESSGAAFFWGILQKKTWRSDVTEKSVMDLLRAGSPYDVSSDMIELWKSKITELGDISDFYIVGDENLKRSFKDNGLISINDLSFEESVCIDVYKKTNAKNSLSIDLPSGINALKILRNPFQSESVVSDDIHQNTVKHKIIPFRPPVFSKNHRKIAVTVENPHTAHSISKHKGSLKKITDSCGVMILSIPNSAGGQAKGQHGKARYIFPQYGEELTGLEIIKRRCANITIQEDLIKLNKFNKNGDIISIKNSDLKIPEEGENFWTVIDQDDYYHSVKSVYVLDSKRDLYKTDILYKDEIFEKIESNVVFVYHIHSLILYGIKREDEIEIKKIPEGDPLKYKLENGGSGKTFFSEYGWGFGTNGLIATNTKGKMWTLDNGVDVHSLINPPDGAEVIGVSMYNSNYTDDNGEYVPFIIVIEKDKKTISIINRSNYYEVYKSVEKISTITVDNMYGNVAFITDNGVFKVYSIARKETLLNIYTGEEV
ncbi:MAG: hypothetical protein GY714_31150 [Desulfobacterales bacterium]|nr:hypothetical protein [Desulfobacterales bacterium]